MHALSELLKKIRDREKLVLDDYQIEHGPTIGKMYEGLTKRLLNESELDKYGAKVVSGFMQVGAHKSRQVDCMVVIGDGQRVPHTDEFIYPISQVLAVMEVKKSLFSTEMADAYEHLNDTLRLSKIDYELREQEDSLNFSTERAATEYMSLFGEQAPRYGKDTPLPFHKRLVYHNLVRDNLTPVRIAIGYNGYKSEQSLRNNIDKIYDGKANQPGYGVINMPNLIISDGFSVVKTNGLPYKGFWDDEDGWGFLATSSENPLLLILELLYDRIELALDVIVDRGPDLKEEVLFPVMLAKPVKTEKGEGWRYVVITEPVPKGEPNSREWTPLEISKSQLDLLVLLREHGRLSGVDPVLENIRTQYAIEDVYEHVRPLLEARLLLNTNGVLSIGATGVAVAKLNDRLYCSDNSGGRFEQWLAKYSPKFR